MQRIRLSAALQGIFSLIEVSQTTWHRSELAPDALSQSVSSEACPVGLLGCLKGAADSRWFALDYL
jgi:hypothetical protein